MVRGATVHTAVGPPIVNGTIVVRDGRLVAIGTSVAVPAGARVIEAAGKVVTPGMIDEHSTSGRAPPTSTTGP